MWTNFFHDGGWGMYPTSICGFALLLVAALVALRPERRYVPLLSSLGAMTIFSGVLGTAVGIANSFRFIHEVPAEKQLGIVGLGIAESLNVVVLSLMLVVIASILASVAAVRAARRAAPEAAR